MEQHLKQLSSLLEQMPVNASGKAFSQLNVILLKYTRILDLVNSHDDGLKSVTNMYYPEIADIRDNIEVSLYGDSSNQKEEAFGLARNKLLADINALYTLIAPKGLTSMSV